MRQIHVFPDGNTSLSETNSNTTVELHVISINDKKVLIPENRQVTKEEFAELSKSPKAKRDKLVNAILEREKTTMKTSKVNGDKL